MKILIIATALVAFLSAARTAAADIDIFACEPEWGALAEEIGGDNVNVENGTNALQDPHFVAARPSLIGRVRRADLVFCTGAQLEIGWLPVLLRQSGNAKVQPGAEGYLAAADYVRKLEIPTSVDRALGDIHPEGNPHIIGNPHNVSLVAVQLAQRLQALDPANADEYAARLADFSQRWEAAVARWESAMAPLRGVPIVVQHKTWVYLTDWLGLNVITTLEPRPGIPPSTSHLRDVLASLGANPPRFIINAAYENDRPSKWLAKRAEVPALTLPYTVGGNKNAKDLFSLFDDTINLLLGGQS